MIEDTILKDLDLWELTCDDHSLDALGEGIGKGIEYDEETCEYSVGPDVTPKNIVNFYVHHDTDASREVVGCIAFFVDHGFDVSGHYDVIKPHLDREFEQLSRYPCENDKSRRRKSLEQLKYILENGIVLKQE